MIPQIFVPIASEFSEPERKGRNVGVVISGLLTGILASRVVSGLVGDAIGWRGMYLIAAALMAVCLAVTVKTLPDISPTFNGSYAKLMRSVLSLVAGQPALRVYSARAGLAFGSFLALWSCLAFKMGQAPFHADSDVVGMLGLCGVAGAVTASFVGRWVKSVGIRRFNYIGCALILAAWASLYFCGDSYGGIISGILLIDIGMQCIQTEQPDQHLRRVPFGVKPREHHLHDHLFHRRLTRNAACRHGLGTVGMGGGGSRRRAADARLAVAHAADAIVKHGLFACKRPCFGAQKATFRTLKGGKRAKH